MIDLDFDYSKVKGSTELHNKFKNEFMVAVCDRFEHVMALPYDVGVFRAFSEPQKIVRCGRKGALDVIVITPNETLWFDMKTGRNSFQANQKFFVNQLYKIKQNKVAFKIKSIQQGISIIEKFG